MSNSDFLLSFNHNYNPEQIEKKWQKYWEQNNCFLTSLEEDSIKDDKNYYVLEMLPYPSGRLHMGHLRNYAIGDAIARFQRAQGKNVLHPMGWDAFGLPAENAAIQGGLHPHEWTMANIATMREQLKKVGFSYDWTKEITTCLPEYYKHEQKMFLDFFKNGLAYQKESSVNWDPIDCTVLANEQVVDGRGWRSGALIEKKKLKQWFLKITDFADSLLMDLENLDQWPEKIKLMQTNWIGKSYGALVKFYLHAADNRSLRNPSNSEYINNSTEKKYIEIYTTRPDTLFGAAFIAIAHDHPLVQNLERSDKLEQFLIKSSESNIDEESLELTDKIGFDTGLKAIHPFDEKVIIPVYIANFVLMDYGTGAVFGCPGHDKRDYEFAKKYNLEIKRVVKESDDQLDEQTLPFCEDGIAINSAFLNGLKTSDAKKIAIEELVKLQKGEGIVQYRLRDWGISRQRYWGCPIPMIYCNFCGIVPVPESDLPVTLPKDISFDQGGNPLKNHSTWKYVSCPICSAKAERETDTFDTFFESSWYFARYCSPNLTNGPFDKEIVNKWLPVNQYIGGSEHAVMHLLYARFFSKALKKCGYWNVNEPFKALLNQGMVCHAAYKDAKNHWVDISNVTLQNNQPVHIKTGEKLRLISVEKMSKSKKNGIDPDRILSKYGADAARMFILSDSPPDKDFEWNERGIEGVAKYLQKLHQIAIEIAVEKNNLENKNIIRNNLGQQAYKSELCHDITLEKQMHKTIIGVTHDMNNHHFNKAIARIRECTNALNKAFHHIDFVQKAEVLRTIAILLNPITPHLSEEIVFILNYCENNKKTLEDHIVTLLESSITNLPWPIANEEIIQEKEIIIAVQINGKMKDTITIPYNSLEQEAYSIALCSIKVQKALHDQKVKNIIYILNKVINIIY